MDLTIERGVNCYYKESYCRTLKSCLLKDLLYSLWFIVKSGFKTNYIKDVEIYKDNKIILTYREINNRTLKDCFDKTIYTKTSNNKTTINLTTPSLFSCLVTLMQKFEFLDYDSLTIESRNYSLRLFRINKDI